MNYHKLFLAVFLMLGVPLSVSAQESTAKKIESIVKQVEKSNPGIKSLVMYNFEKERDVTIADPKKMTEKQARGFVPQFQESMDMFDMFIEKGADPMEAVTYTYIEIASLLQEQGE